MKKQRPKHRRLLITKILVVIGVAIVAVLSYLYVRNQQLLREDEWSFRAMQAEVDAVRDEVSRKTGLPAKKVAYCSHRSEKYKEGPLFCSYGYSFGDSSTNEESSDLAKNIRSLQKVISLLNNGDCQVANADTSTGRLVYAPHLYCQPDTRKAYFPMREE